MLGTIEKKLSAYNDIALLIGRILMGLLFVVAAINAFRNLGGMTTYFGRLGIPMPGVMTPFVATYELVLGALIIVGFQHGLSHSVWRSSLFLRRSSHIRILPIQTRSITS